MLAASQRSEARSVIIKALLVCLGLLLALLLLEVALRLLKVEPLTATFLSVYFRHDEVTGWRGRPGIAMRLRTFAFDSFVSHGPDGFRHAAKPQARHRQSPKAIWVLGDSTTWGWGVSDDETYVYRLNEKANPDLFFRNLGVPGYSVLQEYLLLRELLDSASQAKPGTVFLLFCVNDLYENFDTDSWRPYLLPEGDEFIIQKPVPKPLGTDLYHWLRVNSLAFNHLHFLVRTATDRLRNRTRREEAEARAKFASQQWDALGYVYARIAALCRRHGIEFIPVYPPALYVHSGEGTPERGREYDRAMLAELMKIAELNRLRMIDLTPAFLRYFAERGTRAQPLGFLHDPHLNARGHQVIADGIWRFVEEELDGGVSDS